MKEKLQLASALLIIVMLMIVLLILRRASTPSFDLENNEAPLLDVETVLQGGIWGASPSTRQIYYYSDSQEHLVNLTGGTTVVINASVTHQWDPNNKHWYTFLICPYHNLSEVLFSESDVLSFEQLWTVPYTDTFKFEWIGYKTSVNTRLLIFISVLSPQKRTYETKYVPLDFVVDGSTSWTSYSLDGQTNVTIAGNVTLSGLSDGSHSLTVFARDMAGNIGASETVSFTVQTGLGGPICAWIVAAIIVAIPGVIIGMTLKNNRKRGTGERTQTPATRNSSACAANWLNNHDRGNF